MWTATVGKETWLKRSLAVGELCMTRITTSCMRDSELGIRTTAMAVSSTPISGRWNTKGSGMKACAGERVLSMTDKASSSMTESG